MYGYIVPQKSTLGMSDFVLYRSFYCGICCQTGKLYGNFARFTTNYEFAFLSALMHDYASANVVIEEHGCILNPKKKAILQPNPLLERLAAVNILLSYRKADDGVSDGDGIKYRTMRRMLKKPFAVAKKSCPEAWALIEKHTAELKAIEKAGACGVERAADPFASLMRDLPEAILGVKTDDILKGLCYNVGKFVYLADALDDITDDHKAKRYNPFIATFGGFTDRKNFISSNRKELEDYFFSICDRAEAFFYSMRFNQSYALIRNIVTEGMRGKANELLSSVKKLPPPKI